MRHSLVLSLVVSWLPVIVLAQNLTCFAYTGSSTCSSWAGNKIKAFSGFYTSVATADAWVTSNAPNSASYVSYLQTHYGCTGATAANIATVRYQESLFCDFIVDISTYTSTTVTTNCNSGSVTTAPQLCRSVAVAALNSINATLSNPTICPGTNSNRTSVLSNFLPYLSRLPSSDVTGCIVGNSVDSTTCGYLTTADKTTYCATNPTDFCCTGVAPTGVAIVAATTTAANYVSSAGTNVASTTGSNTSTTNATSTPVASAGTVKLFGKEFPIGVVVGVSIGVVVFIVGIALIAFFIIRRRRASAVVDGHDGNATLHQNKFKRDPTMQRNSEFTQHAYPPQTMKSPYMGDAGFSAAANPSGEEELPPAETMEVAFNYVPNLSDEIYLYVGDPIIVKCKFDDGWGFGFNMTTKQEGCFPVACVVPYNKTEEPNLVVKDKTQSIISAKDYRKRQSSLYVPQGVLKGLPEEWMQSNLNGQNVYSVYTTADQNRETQYTVANPRETQYTMAETEYDNRQTQYTEYTGANRETQYTQYTVDDPNTYSTFTDAQNYGNRPFTEYTQYTESMAPQPRK
ncbi:hypothetical protein HK096_007729 [Nowakowskiella sp. JEL0078]|nr:hypothetical protein HK096_007729 [Nowakowskiella sp. JEL0078]